MFRVSQHPSSGVLKTVTAASGTGHNTGAATSLQRGLIGTQFSSVFIRELVCMMIIFTPLNILYSNLLHTGQCGVLLRHSENSHM